jgi:hypothetical protein
VPGTATFVTRNGNVTGMIRIGAEIYAVEPIGNGLHAVTNIDQTRYPPEHPSSFDSRSKKDMGKDVIAIKASKLLLKERVPYWWCRFYPAYCHTPITVIVAYTPSASAQVTDIGGLIQLAVDEANKSYINSGIYIRLVLVHAYQVTYTESGSFDTDLTRFKTPADGYMDDIHTLRNDYKADIAVLIINNDQYCGLADTILADADEAFATVYYDCATGYYSFAHEIGHLQGARHDCAADPTIAPSYAHGYVNTSGGWRTIMAYNNSACPLITHDGASMGTTCPTENDCCTNNARRLNETRGAMAGFR